MIKRIINIILKGMKREKNIGMYNVEVKDYKRIQYDKLDLI